MLLLVSILKLLTEIAGLALVGQFVLGWLAGAQRETNPIYRLFGWMTAPVLAVARHAAPRSLPERHLPRLALAGLVLLWLATTAAKIGLCLDAGLNTCR